MPTGYTAGILDGKITTFPQFAKICMNAFGACMHMRDEPLGSPYKKAKPSDYYPKKIKELNQRLKFLKTASDERIIEDRKSQIEKDIQYHKKSIAKIKKSLRSFNKILDSIDKWNPPTEDHNELKSFMTKQIKETIAFDCDDVWNKEKIESLNFELVNLDANSIRINQIESVMNELKRAEENLQKDIARCKSANQWVSELLKSL